MLSFIEVFVSLLKRKTGIMYWRVILFLALVIIMLVIGMKAVTCVRHRSCDISTILLLLLAVVVEVDDSYLLFTL